MRTLFWTIRTAPEWLEFGVAPEIPERIRREAEEARRRATPWKWGDIDQRRAAGLPDSPEAARERLALEADVNEAVNREARDPLACRITLFAYRFDDEPVKWLTAFRRGEERLMLEELHVQARDPVEAVIWHAWGGDTLAFRCLRQANTGLSFSTMVLEWGVPGLGPVRVTGELIPGRRSVSVFRYAKSLGWADGYLQGARPRPHLELIQEGDGEAIILQAKAELDALRFVYYRSRGRLL